MEDSNLTKTSRRGPRFWIPWSIVAGLAVTCTAVVVQNRALNEELNDESNLVKNLAAKASKAQQVLEVLTAPGAQRITLTDGKIPAEPIAHATYLQERGGLVLLAANLKTLPADKTYELWVMPVDGAPVPAGLFRADAGGNATVILPQLSPGLAAKTLVITVEKAGGASAPTLPAMLSGTTSSN
jgi:anti-sigma-K factor RskA